MKKPLIKKGNIGFQIISIGQQHWKKGYSYALDACKILKDQDFDFHYTLIGGTKDIELVYHLHDLQLTDVVTLIEYPPNTQVQALLQHADLLLLPSVADDLTPVIFGAMLKNILVLSTDWAGVQDVIIDGETGFIVPKRNTDGLAEKVNEIANLPKAEKDKICNKALQAVRNTFGETQIAADIVDFCKDLKND